MLFSKIQALSHFKNRANYQFKKEVHMSSKR